MATREAELRLKPTMGGQGRRALKRLKDEARSASRSIERGFKDARSEGLRLERTFDAIGRAANHASSTAGQLVGHAMSLKGLAVGLAAGGAGKTIFDSMIGSNATLESQRITFNTMMGDVQKATSLMNELRSYAASTPFAQGDLIDGSKRLLRLTGENVDQNVKLVKLASQMAAINPDKTISDAAEAILDAEGLEFERLKEFGLKLKRDDLKKMKKRGETLGQTALRGVEEALAKQTGGRDVVAALSQSFNGKLSTLKDNFTEMMREAGEPGFEVLKNGLDDIGSDFAKLRSDPEFKRDLKELAGFTADMAKGSVRLARALPGAIRDARAFIGDAKKFIEDNQTILGITGGALAAHKLTGGASTRGALALGSRVLFGKKGGGAGGALAEFGGAQPVYVVNMPGGGIGGAGSFLQRNAAGVGASAGGGVLRSLATKGIVGTLGAGPTAAIAGGAAFLGGQLYLLGKVTEGSTRALEGFEKRADKAEKAQRDLELRRARLRVADVAKESRAMFSVDTQQARLLDDARLTAQFARRGNRREQERLKGIFTTLSQTASPEELARIEKTANRDILGRLGLAVDLKAGVSPKFLGKITDAERRSGQVQRGGALEAAMRLNNSAALMDDKQRGLQFAAAGANVAAGLRQLMGDINVSVQGNATAETAQLIAKTAADEVENRLRGFQHIYGVLSPSGG